MNNIGVINEQGDMGLGFYETTDEEQDIIKKNEKKQEEKE